LYIFMFFWQHTRRQKVLDWMVASITRIQSPFYLSNVKWVATSLPANEIIWGLSSYVQWTFMTQLRWGQASAFRDRNILYDLLDKKWKKNESYPHNRP
jgi:hypothetical protein